MLRIGMGTDKGPMAIIGINYENMVRMKAGMPLDIDLKPITPRGQRITRVFVHYAHTYAEVVEDMAQGGMPVNDDVREEARRLDEQLKRERREG